MRPGGPNVAELADPMWRWPSKWKHEIMVSEFAVPTKERIAWSECSLVEVKPGVQSGAPVLIARHEDARWSDCR